MKSIEKNTLTSDGNQFTADKDYYGETDDGRKFLIIAEGQSIPMQEAQEKGIVKTMKKDDSPEKAEAPAENKSTKPAKNKAEAPAENKGGAE